MSMEVRKTVENQSSKLMMMLVITRKSWVILWEAIDAKNPFVRLLYFTSISSLTISVTFSFYLKKKLQQTTET